MHRAAWRRSGDGGVPGARLGRGEGGGDALRQPARPRAPARPRRPARGQPPRADVGRRPRREVERLALAAEPPRQRPRRDRADPRADRRGARGPVGARQVPGRRHALLHQPDRPQGPRGPDPPPDHPARARAAELHGDDGGLARRGPPLAGPGPGPPLPGPGPDADHDPVRVVLPVLHAEPDRRRPHPELQPEGARGAARLHPAHAPDPRRADLGRRRPDAGAQAPRVRPARPARHPARRDHPDRLAGPGVPAAADRRRAVRDARQVPPDVDEHPRQPPPGDHPGAVAGLRQAVAGRASRWATSRSSWPA